MNGFDLSTISSLYYGSNQCRAIYKGSTLIFKDYSAEYFTIESLEDNNELMFYGNTLGGSNDLYYSIDDGNTWSTTQQDDTNPFIIINTGDKVKFKHNGAIQATEANGSFIKCSKNHNMMGNIQSLFYYDSFKGTTDLKDLTPLSYFFCNNTNLISAENLILPHLYIRYMGFMSTFEGCTNLTKPPVIKALELRGNFAMRNMFKNCSSLQYVPSLSVTNLSSQTSVFYQCFRGCSSITTVPQNYLSNMYNLGGHCFREMFYGCTSLTNVPDLPATTLATYCYANMFQGCTNLTTIPSNLLPATTLSERCYSGMFQECTSLTTVPQLSATTLATYCYYAMFYNCTSLTTALSILPATTLADYCYWGMFHGCTSLIEAPQLSATTLADTCCSNMFRNCTSLETAPTLPALTLTTQCYYQMFQGCSNLNYVKMLATDISASNCMYNWLSGVSSTGTFVKNSAATWTKTGASGIPSNWTVETASS